MTTGSSTISQLVRNSIVGSFHVYWENLEVRGSFENEPYGYAKIARFEERRIASQPCYGNGMALYWGVVQWQNTGL